MRKTEPKKRLRSYADCMTMNDYYRFIRSRSFINSYEEDKKSTECYNRCLKNDSIKYWTEKKKR